MKLPRYTIVNLFLICLPIMSFAGGYSPAYEPGEYRTFRIYNPKDKHVAQTTAQLNIMEWQEYAEGRVSYDDVWKVVYEYTIEDLQRIKRHEVVATDSSNSFANYLINKNDEDAIDFLILAKECEERRSNRTDKWWYPTKKDLNYADMQEIIDKSLGYGGKKLRLRHLLQAIRAAFTMGNYDLCLQLWNDEASKYPSSAVKTMCEGYIGGIYFRRGDYGNAIGHYANNAEQYQSFWWCADNLTAINTAIDRIKVLYKYAPDSPELTKMVQDMCREAEDRANLKIFSNKDVDAEGNNGYDFYINDRAKYMALRDFALNVVSEGKVENPAMWQYTASFLTLMDGDFKLASQYLAEAEKLKGTPFVKDGVKVLRIMLDGMLGSYDADFEAQMLNHLEWLDRKIVDNIADFTPPKYEWYDNYVFRNISVYYYHDMMRKLLLSVLAPRYMQLGKPVKALLLTGVASERLRAVTNFRNSDKKKRFDKEWSMHFNGENRNIDFYTDIFRLMDTIPIRHVIEYKNVLQRKNGSPFDVFLAQRCYNNSDYFNEIIGTGYMRELKFEEALKYLSKVSSGYENALNISHYFFYDPFKEPFIRKVKNKVKNNNKLHFATRMNKLLETIKNSGDRESVLDAKFQYVLGLTRSIDDCWPLLKYKKSVADYGREKPWEKHILECIDNALNEIVETSNNPETVAKCYALNMWRNKTDLYIYTFYSGEWEMVKNADSKYARIAGEFEHYSNTKVFEELTKSCDTFKFYQKNRILNVADH